MINTRFNPSCGAVGVDFGASGVKMLQLRRQSDRLRAVAACRLPLADAPGFTAAAIRTALANHGFTGRRCVVSLPRTDVVLQAVRLPRMPDPEMRQAARWEAAERFKLDRDSIEVDFVRMGEVQRPGEARDEVLLIAASHERLQARLEPLLAAGLRPIAVDTSFGALVRCHSLLCRREADRSYVRALLEVGASGSTFLVLRGDQISLCKPISIGGESLDRAVAEHLGIDLAVARDLRAKRIVEQRGHAEQKPRQADSSTERAVFEATRSLMDRLVTEVGLCLRYYGVTFRGKPPERIILTGGDGLEPRLAEMLASSAKLPVVVDDPNSPVADLFDEVAHMAGAQAGPPQAWAVAAGLSIRDLSSRTLRQLEGAESEQRRRAA